jgi:hypothetical protein
LGKGERGKGKGLKTFTLYPLPFNLPSSLGVLLGTQHCFDEQKLDKAILQVFKPEIIFDRQ